MLLLDVQFAERALREGSYLGGSDGSRIYFQDADTVRDALDLYTVISETADTGSPNLENQQALDLVSTLQGAGGFTTVNGGGVLSAVQVGQLLGLLEKHGDAIARLRRSPDRDGQDPLRVPEPESALIINGGM